MEVLITPNMDSREPKGISAAMKTVMFSMIDYNKGMEDPHPPIESVSAAENFQYRIELKRHANETKEMYEANSMDGLAICNYFITTLRPK